MALGQNQEVEIKVAIPNLAALEEQLRSLNFRILHPRVFEANVIYDLPGGDLRARGELIRLRQSGERAVFTYKGPATVKRHKEREELEVHVGQPDVFDQILRRLGYVPRFRYEKYRTEWSLPGEDGVLMVDETPIGNYLEIEGTPEWIDHCAARLGFHPADYIFLSYARLYVQICAEKGMEARDMIFESTAVAGSTRLSDGDRP